MSSSYFILSEEDEAIEKAMALSLITAREDELRRRQLYHSVETIPQHVANERTSEGLHASSSYPNLTEDLTTSSTANTIARPRPQGKVVGNTTLNLPVAKPRPSPRSPRKDDSTRPVPVVPPRPSKAAVSPPNQQPSSRQVDLMGNPGRTGPTASGVPPRPSVSPNERTLTRQAPRQQNTHTNHTTPPKAKTDKPLITLSPSILPNLDDFDMSSFDPLNTSRPCSVRAASSHTSFAADVHVLLNAPGGSTIPFSMSGTVPAPLFSASSSSFGMAATLSYPPYGSTGSGKAVPFYPPCGSTSSGPVNPTCDTTGSIAAAPSYPQRGSTGSVVTAPPLPPTGPFYPPCGRTFTDNKVIDKPFFGNDAFYNIGVTAPTRTPQANGPGSAGTNLNNAQTEDVARSHDVSYDSDDNLMQFAADYDHEEFLSLESFDPLYSMEQLTPPDDATNATDSLELFPNPYDKFERKETPNPFPVVDPASTQKLLRQSGVYATSRLSSSSSSQDVTVEDPPSASAAVKGHSRNESTGSNSELMDPFSVSNLTKVLERKRRKHEEEQRERKAQMKKKEAQLREDEREKAGKERFSRQTSYLSKGQEVTYETLYDSGETPDEEIQAFCQMVGRLTWQYKHGGVKKNMGLVMSRKLPNIPTTHMEVKVIVTAKFLKDPVTFTCNLNASVDQIISTVLFTITEDLGSISTDAYIIKVHGLSEYLNNDSTLGEYEYVQQCLKLDLDIRLILCDVAKVPKSFNRTAEDDKHVVFVPKAREVDEAMKVTRGKLNILMETFYKEVEKLRDHAIQGEHIQSSGVVQAVKAICMTLCNVETNDIIKAIRKLLAASGDKPDGAGSSADRRRSSQLDSLHLTLEEVTRSVKCMIELYCRTFHTDFRFDSAANIIRERKDVKSYGESLLIHISTMHRVPKHWLTQYEDFKVMCDIYYGGRSLALEIETTNKPSVCGRLLDTVIWDEWLQFDAVFLDCLPREARLGFTVIGVKTMHSGSASEIPHKVRTPLGWVALQVFNHKFQLVQGSQLLGLWNGDRAKPTGTAVSNTDHPSSILLQVNLPEFDNIITFPDITNRLPSMAQDFLSLHPDDQEQLQSILEKDAATRLSAAESELVWEKRHYLYKKPEALPRVLQAAHSWDWSNLAELYTMMKDWTPLTPLQALELLLPSYADTYVRTVALNSIRELSSDELLDYLPQLVQALKFESYHTAGLAQFLLEQSIVSVRIAHQLYWVIKEAADDIHFKKRYHLLFGALLSVVGVAMRQELSREEDFVRMLSAVADKVKTAKDRDKDTVLQTELCVIGDFLQQQDTVRLPLNPAMEVLGFDVKSCSYFSSNTFPLRLVMRNVDLQAESIYTMFKVGDDLRQDMLTMQLIGIMDRLWLQHGHDLKIITFKCQATAAKKGLVELITDSETLRKIQVKHGHGLAGSFRDHSIASWLQTQNPTELDYQKAIDNFTSSCAGYCVATYLLGVCDRHNDNIMIKYTGHMFHIDFGKFLGDSQMFGNFKRDRVPFVLTSDMAYVINGGDKSSCKFQEFVDLCCSALNVLRHHGNLFLNLFSIMVNSNIPGVNKNALKYVQKALLPEHTDAEVTAIFTRMIDESLRSTFTQINFFLHNLAQMKFSGHTEGALLSFIPKTYSIHTDGKISSVEIYGYQKRYNPEKYYIYILKVERVKQTMPSFVFRRYSEFQELHHKLLVTFSLARLPSLSGRVILGRTHVRSVAAARKEAVETFIKHLFKLEPEISENDVVYTFFHPMLRDEQDIDKTNLMKLKEKPCMPMPDLDIHSQIKLSLFYKNSAFTVMVMHVKDLVAQGDEAPDPYVKLYLLPDPMKLTKRKTKIAKGTFHPTYNEMLIYRMLAEEVNQRQLQVTVWSYDALKENEFLGAIVIDLADINLSRTTTQWYHLHMHC